LCHRVNRNTKGDTPCTAIDHIWAAHWLPADPN
jgi:hypothetical protein